MIFPNKLVLFKDCVLAKTVYILDALTVNESSVEDLFHKTKQYFSDDVNQFILALDVLFMLAVIELDLEKRVVRYVEANSVR